MQRDHHAKPKKETMAMKSNRINLQYHKPGTVFISNASSSKNIVFEPYGVGLTFQEYLNHVQSKEKVHLELGPEELTGHYHILCSKDPDEEATVSIGIFIPFSAAIDQVFYFEQYASGEVELETRAASCKNIESLTPFPATPDKIEPE